MSAYTSYRMQFEMWSSWTTNQSCMLHTDLILRFLIHCILKEHSHRETCKSITCHVLTHHALARIVPYAFIFCHLLFLGEGLHKPITLAFRQSFPPPFWFYHAAKGIALNKLVSSKLSQSLITCVTMRSGG